MHKDIFHDPTGRRARRAGVVLGIVLSLTAAVVAGFFVTFAFAPRLPDLALRDPQMLRALHVETARRIRGRPAWRRVPRLATSKTSGRAKPLTVGFYVSWDEASRASLRANVGRLDVVSPQWIQMRGPAGEVVVTEDPQAVARIAAAPNHPAVLPLVHNSANGSFNGRDGDSLLASPAARSRLIARLTALAQTRGYGGYVLDLEDLSEVSLRAYPGFVTQVRAALKPIGREVWVTAPFDGEGWPLRRLQRASDALVLMAYDEHYGRGDPGPNAGQDWFQIELDRRGRTLDPAKTILALGAYGYDWPVGQDIAPGAAVTFHEALQLAADSGVDIATDDDSLNPTFRYQDDAGLAHVVWFLDATTVFNAVKASDSWRPRGYAVWRMGMEDPGVWTVLGHPPGQASATGLRRLAAGQTVDFHGEGEVLRVGRRPTAGRRTLTFDPDTGLIAREHYDAIPTGYIIERFGRPRGPVALTFDDGPDPRWTGRILDILKAKQAPATFFVIGENMQRNPDLVTREVREGHEVGSHTWTHPNIAETPLSETKVELNATQRLFEVLTGRSMRLFRPPYFGDAEPSTPAEVMPLVTAQRLGYLTVGLRIDPDDWQKPTSDQIVQRVLDRLDHPGDRPGQVVLLHDSGGNRSRTVAALPGLIDAIRAHGYRLTTVGELAGMTSAQAMPAATRDPVELTLDRMGFGFFRAAQATMTVLFLGAIVLGMARLVFLAGLALTHGRTWRAPADIDPKSGPLVSVLIPCFNEEKVIVSAISRILESDWTSLEVLVLDDGSGDATADRVREAFGAEPRVTLMSFPNGGKARALNRGLAMAKGEIVIALDADTQFPPPTIGKLVRWFQDPKIGAVAGNALVGNRLNLVTRWQALEYVTAQNLERRALASLGAVTVVPGAVGGWRRQTLIDLGGYPADTLAEDQDLTIAAQRAGWKVAFDPEALAWTEAPDTVRGLLKQRFRWSFGTLQCLWKHRSAMFSTKHPVLGFVALPQIWLFQILLAVVAPLVDLAVLWSLGSAIFGAVFRHVDWSPDDSWRNLFYWAAFIMVDLSAGALGMALERRAPWRDFWLLPAQRFGYRQLMYYVVLKSLATAVRGARVGWGRLERKATVSVSGPL